MVNEITEVITRKGIYHPTINPTGVTFQTIAEFMAEKHPEEPLHYDGQVFGLGVQLVLPQDIREERFLLEHVRSSGVLLTDTGFEKQVTMYMWEGQLLNDTNIPAPENHISAPLDLFFNAESPLPFKVKPVEGGQSVALGILPTVNVQGKPQFPLHFGGVTQKVINPNVIQLTFSVDDEKNQMGELVLNLKATYRALTSYSVSAF